MHSTNDKRGWGREEGEREGGREGVIFKIGNVTLWSEIVVEKKWEREVRSKIGSIKTLLL